MGGATRWGEKEGDDPESYCHLSPGISGCRASGDPAADEMLLGGQGEDWRRG
jgi:hypothetical protein